MAIGTPTVLADNTNSTDGTSYTISVPTPQTAGTQAFLCMYSGRTTADAVHPSSITGPGVSGTTTIDSVTTNNGNNVQRLYTLQGTLTGNLTVTYSITMGSVGWILVQVPGVDTTAPVVQTISSANATNYNGVTSGKIGAALPALVGTNNAVLSFAQIASTAGSLDPLTAGLTEITGDSNVTGPVIHTGGAYSLAATGGQTFEWYSDAASQKSIINVEIKAASFVDPWTYRKFVRIG